MYNFNQSKLMTVLINVNYICKYLAGTHSHKLNLSFNTKVINTQQIIFIFGTYNCDFLIEFS